MFDKIQLIATLLFGGGGLLAGLIAIFMVRANKGKVVADTKETEMRAIQLSDSIDAEREKRWQAKVDNVKQQWEEDVDELREEIGWLKLLIENHVPWDWEMQRKMTMAGIEHPKPPTLNYIKGRTPKEA
ncbi:membrane protein [Mycobacterium phage Patience]|uniref:Uncharacterized protein n=2 Tax=Patiencevirus patience TaxID=1982360 RepID=A0A0K1LT42_9CAUD|nr:membrane protein [Mycobacterium phage Patience]AEL97954.1 hypothetical protein PATIENCE_45 [Mycobacterium phage Patience]AKU45333.1 hypothetical protein MADRUGA_43 [Mycobacterium phage Madruga]UOW93370.1 membrane protein [Mycobacterium phage Labelle]